MMTDDEIIAVVQAHKEGKKIEYCSNQFRVWFPLTCSREWGRFDSRCYRVAPKQEPKELWLQDCGGGMWQEKFTGWGRHFQAVDVAPEPRKPREWTLCDGRDHENWIVVPPNHDSVRCGGESVRVREVIE